MFLIYLLASFSLVIGVYALFWKLAARILRYGGVSWRLAFLTAATIVFALAFARGVLSFVGISAPAYFGIALGLPITIAIGAWCFHDRATRPDGKPVDWPGAFKLSGVAVALNTLAGLLILAVAMTMNS
ncbi:MAG TPA: hypothetical protein VJT13_01580 [Xanthobacteraceae bacterium]|nr:hypothetical protein [Steroidobacteraceae bacterium]HKS60356.1 hypothetical protein [Xanthobacteraceae bacterium]